MIAAVATEGEPCEEGGMVSDSRDRQRDADDKPGQHEANTCPIHGVEFVVTRGEAGEATLDVINAHWNRPTESEMTTGPDCF